MVSGSYIRRGCVEVVDVNLVDAFIFHGGEMRVVLLADNFF